MSCPNGALVKSFDGGFELAACTCDAWGCERCAPRRKARLRDELLSGHPNRMMTLTCVHGRYSSPEEADRDLMRCFHLIIAQIRYDNLGAEVEYGWVKHAHDDGYPHLHVLLRSPWLDRDEIIKRWKKLIGAWNVDIRRVPDEEIYAAYVAGYAAGGPAKFGNSKRYCFSRGYRPPQDEADQTDRPVAFWRWDPNEIERLVAAAEPLCFKPRWRGPNYCSLTYKPLPPRPQTTRAPPLRSLGHDFSHAC